MSDNGRSPDESGATNSNIPQYLGIGCISAVVGLVCGGMIAVLIAKIAGGLGRCAADPETGAPCNWTEYWTWGARIGLVVVPIATIWLFRRGRRRAKNSDRG